MWDVDGLLESMSSRQLAEWMAYAAVEPFGDELLDVHLAQLNANMINKDRKRSQKVEAKRFRFWKPEQQKWDPQAWFQGLKDTVQLTKNKT